jgi:hypothetical protein
MALIKCSECGAEVSDSADKCIKCGYGLKQNQQSSGLALVLGLLLVVGGTCFSGRYFFINDPPLG